MGAGARAAVRARPPPPRRRLRVRRRGAVLRRIEAARDRPVRRRPRRAHDGGGGGASASGRPRRGAAAARRQPEVPTLLPRRHLPAGRDQRHADPDASSHPTHGAGRGPAEAAVRHRVARLRREAWRPRGGAHRGQGRQVGQAYRRLAALPLRQPAGLDPAAPGAVRSRDPDLLVQLRRLVLRHRQRAPRPERGASTPTGGPRSAGRPRDRPAHGRGEDPQQPGAPAPEHTGSTRRRARAAQAAR